MAITRINMETIIVARLGGLMEEAGLAITFLGSNADLNDPICVALRQMGESIANLSAVADADLSGVAEANFNELLDRTELRTLETIEGNLTLVDITTGPRSEKLSQMVSFAQTRKKQLMERIEREYGITTLEAGYLALDFAEHDDE